MTERRKDDLICRETDTGDTTDRPSPPNLPSPPGSPSSISNLLLFQGTIKADFHFKWQLWQVTRQSDCLLLSAVGATLTCDQAGWLHSMPPVGLAPVPFHSHQPTATPPQALAAAPTRSQALFEFSPECELRERRGEREREKHRSVVFHTLPDQGSNPQPKHVP